MKAATSVAVALCLLAGAADAAQTTATSRGVQAAAGTIWYDQTAGEPIVSFPLGCTAATCQYSLWLEYIPRGEEPVYNQSEPVVDVMDRCAAWIVFRDPVLPLRGSFALHFKDGVQLNEALIHATGRVETMGHQLHANNGFGPQVFGAAYQYLTLSSWWIEIAGQNCLMGYRACYHPHRKGFDNNGLSCPLSE
jgi:hypothetical protein